MKKYLILLNDLLMLYSALLATLAIRYRANFTAQYNLHLTPFLILFFVWIVIFYITNLYEVRLLRNNATFYSDLFRAGLFAGVLSVAFFYFIPLYGITPKTNLFIFIAIFMALAAGSRTFINTLIGHRFKKRILIVGTNPQSQELNEFVAQNPQLGYTLANLMDISSGIQAVNHVLANEKIDVVVVSPEVYQVPALIDTFYQSLPKKIMFQNLASFYEQLTGRVPLGAINQVWFLENISGDSHRLYGLGKRLIDVVLAVLMSIPFLISLPFISLLIALNSPGPVFYRQKRVGKLGKIFEMIKLRTMRQNAEQSTGAVWTQENDPRITKVGNFLRKTRIDELPQLWNIFKGEMSFVGPRAERPEFHQKLTAEIPYYEERYLIEPGAAGWAQLHKSYYASVADTVEKLQYDLYYIKNRSLFLDIGILLRTINTALRQAGR